MLVAIAAHGLRCHVSVKLSQLGLDISRDLALELLLAVVAEAARDRTFVRVDMEDSARVPAIFEIVERVWDAGIRNVGVAVQAYLYRSQDDITRLAARGVPVRLCKGAYAEPPDRAFSRKADVDRQFARLAEYLLTHGAHAALATHDERLIRRAIAFAAAQQIAPDRFEFQLLHGIRRDLQETLPRQGFRVRVYVPFGTHWYPYFMRRLAERPANLLFILRHLVRA
jgi:proline dehydrogenase